VHHRKLITAAIAIGALAILVPVALATSSTTAFKAEAHVASNTGPNAINPATCKFLHRERDVVTNLGTLEQKLSENGRYDISEDARHDRKMNCLTNLVNTVKKTITQPAHLHYIRVMAEGTGPNVVIGCPSGYHVVGGGSQSEVTGSYPSTDDTWTIVRDHLSPKVLVGYAVCIRLVS
jgi:hypothetical protein